MRCVAAALARSGRALLAGRCPPPALASAAATMPGRNKGTSGYGCPEAPAGQQPGESGSDARGRLPHTEEDEEDRGGGCSNLGDPDIVKSPSDPKQYRFGDSSP